MNDFVSGCHLCVCVLRAVCSGVFIIKINQLSVADLMVVDVLINNELHFIVVS